MGGGAVEFKGIVHLVDNDDTHLTCPEVVLGVVRDHAHLKYIWLLGVHDLVEDVVVSFSRKLVDDTRLLKQVDFNVTSRKFTSVTEVDTDELTETGRIVVTDGLGVTPGLKNGVGLDNLIFKTDFSFLSGSRSSDGGHVTNDLLGVLSLSSTRFTSSQDGLTFTFSQHVLVCVVSNGVQMGWAFSTLLTTVHVDDDITIDWQPLVRVDTDTEKTGVCVDPHDSVSSSQVVQDGSFVKMGHVSHVNSLFELSWVSELNLFLRLGDSVALISLDGAFTVNGVGNLTTDVSLLLVFNPAGELGQGKVGKVQLVLSRWLQVGHSLTGVIASPLGGFLVRGRCHLELHTSVMTGTTRKLMQKRQ